MSRMLGWTGGRSLAVAAAFAMLAAPVALLQGAAAGAEPSGRILARASSIDALGTERLIAQLEDTNGDGVVSVGDTVRAAEYPLDFAGNSYGSFASTVHVVDAVFADSGTTKTVHSGSSRFIWSDIPDAEVYSEYDVNNPLPTATEFADALSAALIFGESIRVRAISPSLPATDFSVSRAQLASDDNFLNIELNPVTLCDGLPATHVGTSAAETITGTAGDDVIVALSGNDTIVGGGGNDTVCAGSGDDAVTTGAGDDRIFGEAGADDIRSLGGNDYIEGGGGNDTIRSGGGNDTVSGDGGDDNIILSNGVDQATGGPGSDSINGGAGRDTITGNGGDDTLRGQGNNDNFHAGPGNDTVRGNAGNDTLNGNSGDDVLLAASGDDVLNGGNDDDTLWASTGTDNMDGGNGTDHCDGGNDLDTDTATNCETTSRVP